MSVTWCLMRMVSKNPGQQGHHSLAYVRDLQEGEKAQIDQAMNMLRSFASNRWEWNKIDLAFTSLLKAIEAAIDSKTKANGHFSENERIILSRTVAETAEAIVSWPSAVLSGNSEHPGTDDESRQEISQLAAKLTDEDSILDALKKIADAHDDSLADLASSNGAHIAYLKKGSLDSAGVQSADNWTIIELFSFALAQVERLAALTLKSYRESVESAARIIQGIHGEVLYGLPMLIPKENLKNLGADSGTDLQLSPVEKPDVEGVLRAADVAADMLKKHVETPDMNPRVTPAQPTTSPPSDQVRNEPEYAPKASSLPALLGYASSLSAQAENAWSTALDPQKREAHREIIARWVSFIASLKNHIEDQEIEPEGAVARFPVDAGYFRVASGPRDVRNMVAESSIAEVYAVRNLVESMKGLQQPTVSSINLVSGEEQTWWDSGAFCETRKAAEAALRITQRRERLAALARTDQSTEGQLEESRGHGLLFAKLGRECVSQGYYEAAVLYFSLSVRQLANEVEVQRQGDDDPVGRIVRIRGAEVEAPTRLLMEIAKGLAAGNSTHLERFVVLGNFWAAEIANVAQAVFDHSRGAADRVPEEG